MSRSGPIDRLSKVKGTDFVHFYVLGSIARSGAWTDLYDMRAQTALTRAIVPQNPDIVYVPIESPQTALLMAPVATLNYTSAFLVWVAIIIATYIGCCWAMWRDLPHLHARRAETIAVAAAFPGLFSVVLHGQTSFVALACVVAALIALRRGAKSVAGLALGLLVFKPHWLVAAGAVFLFAREWRVVAAAAGAAAAETAVTFVCVGASAMAAYSNALRALPRIADLLEPRASDSLKGFFQVLLPGDAAPLALYAGSAVTTLVLTARVWRSEAAFEIRGAALVLAMILVSPHVNPYDLILLAPVLFLTSAWLEQSREESTNRLFAPLLAILFCCPILVALPALIRLQFTVTAMAALLVVIWHTTRANVYSRRALDAQLRVRHRSAEMHRLSRVHDRM